MLYYEVVQLKFMLLTNVTEINLIKKNNYESVSMSQKSITNAVRKLGIERDRTEEDIIQISKYPSKHDSFEPSLQRPTEEEIWA